MNVYCVPVEAIEPIWSKVECFFSRALSKHDAEFSLDDLKNYLLKSHWKLFAFVNDDDTINGAAVVSFLSYPKSYVAFVTCIGGKDLVNPQNYDKFMESLKSYGADRVQGYVRDSVARLYRKVGVIRTTTMVEVKL
jgi:phage-related protein